MSRLGLVLASLAALAVFGAANAGSASAFSWWIAKEGGGEELLKGREAFNEESVVHTPFTLSSKAIGITVSCGAARYEGGYIEGPVGLGAKAIKFGKCKLTGVSGCAVEHEEVKTVELTGTISRKEKGAPIIFELKPAKGVVFTVVNLTGSGCPEKEVAIEDGPAKGEITEAEKLTTEKSFLFNKESSLKSFGSPVEVEGELGYSAKKGWSAH